MADCTWTTNDERKFLRGLADDKKVDALRNYIGTIDQRDWSGKDMSVNPYEVRAMAKLYLAEVNGTRVANPSVM